MAVEILTWKSSGAQRKTPSFPHIRQQVINHARSVRSVRHIPHPYIQHLNVPHVMRVPALAKSCTSSLCPGITSIWELMPGTVLSGIGTIPICQNGRRFKKPSEKKLPGSHLNAEITQAQDLVKSPRKKVLSHSLLSSVAFIKQTSSSKDDLAFSDNSCQSDRLNTCS